MKLRFLPCLIALLAFNFGGCYQRLETNKANWPIFLTQTKLFLIQYSFPPGFRVFRAPQPEVEFGDNEFPISFVGYDYTPKLNTYGFDVMFRLIELDQPWREQGRAGNLLEFANQVRPSELRLGMDFRINEEVVEVGSYHWLHAVTYNQHEGDVRVDKYLLPINEKQYLSVSAVYLNKLRINSTWLQARRSLFREIVANVKITATTPAIK